MKRRTLICVSLVAALCAASCGDDTQTSQGPDAGIANAGTADAGGDSDAPDAPDADEPPQYTVPPVDCDSLDPAKCALPWPSSLYLAADDATPTGHRLVFGETSLPANAGGRHIAPTRYERLDGYGFGTPIMTIFPGVDVSQMPAEGSIERSMEASSQSLLFEVTGAGLERVPHWVELDRSADDPASQVLFMRPATILSGSTRYVVAYRDLRDSSGAAIPPSAAFAALRDDTMTDDPAVESRRDAYAELFTLLDDAGVDRESLTLAWEFTTGSEENLHHYADEATRLALEEVGDDGATFEFADVEAFEPTPDGSLPQDDHTAYRITGTMLTPSVLAAEGTFNEFNFVDDRLAVAESVPAPIHITIPHRAAAGEEVGVILYGHGMLGSSQEVFAGHLRQLGEELGYVMVGVDFRGMSSDDTAGLLPALFDMSNFNHLAEGTVQGIAQTHVLAHAAQTSLEAALQAVDPDVQLNDDIQWFGASQGGIFGASIMATSPVFRRGILAVPGNNYSMLLQRSVNFEPFFDQLDNAYGDAADLALVIAAVQLQWDMSDPVTFWRRLAQDDGPQGPRDALLLVSKGDKQVAVVTNEILARSYSEVPLMEHYDVDREPWGAPMQSYPHQGSGQILFDFGNEWPTERGNQPPDDELPDPHSRIAEVDAVSELLRSFLADSTIIDVCGGDGCRPD